MVFSKSLDESGIVWRGFNANYANEANVAKIKRKFASSLAPSVRAGVALFALFALRVFRLCESHAMASMVFSRKLDSFTVLMRGCNTNYAKWANFAKGF